MFQLINSTNHETHLAVMIIFLTYNWNNLSWNSTFNSFMHESQCKSEGVGLTWELNKFSSWELVIRSCGYHQIDRVGVSNTIRNLDPEPNVLKLRDAKLDLPHKTTKSTLCSCIGLMNCTMLRGISWTISIPKHAFYFDSLDNLQCEHSV